MTRSELSKIIPATPNIVLEPICLYLAECCLTYSSIRVLMLLFRIFEVYLISEHITIDCNWWTKSHLLVKIREQPSYAGATLDLFSFNYCIVFNILIGAALKLPWPWQCGIIVIAINIGKL